ncbi:hypothetical protein HMPREF1411_00210 [Helicobacter pylori GAM250AFi]|nr:hypothetical protein HMPREF1411_00210 [Helicobacter pylori GAM250AFi]EMH12221.1 hypothetical protein HMPREF1414_01634 [Helicobacter pylori GAM252T]EMH14803.1 hypothetical protein HMPREF1412_00577 [Helicobacter pylori GAM250T]EMH15386.1 hypothetical protein HMPREF1413_00550 [Helicobacter pylori GAM252Bi]EMH49704.1 hypothetical protein HMPREF1439_00331 [Helicobacter pylori HP250AFiii]EMH49784.1 hypothetical protein HMPREF1438_00134 [Helicobacter pylori HP250AFii]EMH50882.1 hypothetical prote
MGFLLWFLKSYRLLEIKNELVFYSPPHSLNGYAISKRALLEKKFDIQRLEKQR